MDATRIITFDPAFDRRSSDPKKDYGIHGVNLRCVLKGPLGAVSFVLYTNWQLPEVTKELAGRHYEAIDGDPHWMERPMPADIGYHSPVPMYEGQSINREACEFLDGRPCYHDGSGLNAQKYYEILLREGSDGLWAALETYYHRTFETPAAERTVGEAGFKEVLSALMRAIE